ncbi:MAG: AAA family ATPase, partial [Muribaculaceae bacterium]|nr:AAA family ATPase [Muribaculaceae bacterium]
MTNRTTEIDLENEEFQQAYRLLKDSNANVFLTGRAGTGKSTFLRYLCQHLQKKYVVLAPTGVAAVNVGGVTIHSFFQMPLRPVPPDDPDYSVGSFKKTQKFSRQKRKLLRELELIIIDEVSMVRPDMIDFIDRVLRGVTGRRGKPFGGVQLLLVGDIFQLEPVVNADTRLILSKYYDDFFFFNAKAYNSTNLVSIELKKIYRQSDPSFIGILDRVRNNSVTYEDVALLNRNVINKKCEDISDADFGITLTSRRDIASNINRDKMESLPGEEFIFKGEINDDFPEKLLPTDLNLVLKKDAQVMLIRNDKDRRWVNGTLAKITEISQTSITVKLENGNEEKVEREIWSNITYTYDEKEKKVKEEILGTFVQFPLRAAWALTIHKSQGLTFNNVAIDMGAGAFSAGQTYVALSRCRTLEGIQFINPIKRGDVIVSKGARSFSKGFNDT